MERSSLNGFLAISFMGALAFAAPCAAATIYVDAMAPASGDGASWGTAFDDLQDALGAVQSGDQIWVAQGTYLPTADPADRLATFALVDGVSMYGGFSGIETHVDQRDPVAHPTILSGDVLGDDGGGSGANAENVYHVVTAIGLSATARLDGFVITAGWANGSSAPHCFGGVNNGQPCSGAGDCPGEEAVCVSADGTGAGLLIRSSSPEFVRCTITGNNAAFQGAGAMMKDGSAPTFTDCLFIDNAAGDNGGAVYAGFSTPLFADCQFIGNAGGRYAGAACLRDLSDAVFQSCLFDGNTAAVSSLTGGGAIVNASSSPTFDDCTFTNNVSIAGNGGAIYNKRGFDAGFGPSAPNITNCMFDSNSAANHGGAVYSIEGSQPVVSGSTFSLNGAVSGAGTYTADGARLTVCDSEFGQHTNNRGANFYVEEAELYVERTTVSDSVVLIGSGGTAFGYGAGVYAEESFVSLDACTFDGMTAERYGACVYINGYDSSAVIDGCVFENSSAELGGTGVFGALMQTVTISNSTFRGLDLVTTKFGGTAVLSLDTTFDITNSVFRDNTSSHLGGAIHALVGGNFITCSNSVFWNNIGGDVVIDGLAVRTNEVTLTNCTLSRPAGDSGLHNTNGQLRFENSIIWNTSLENMGDTTVAYSTYNMMLLPGGPGSSNDDPRFVDLAAGNLNLLPTSPCVDAGDNGVLGPEHVTDVAGFPRFVDRPDVADTGVGPGPIVDIGAYELQLAVTCPEDLDGSGDVGFADLLRLFSAWGACATKACPEDLDQSGDVGFGDLLVLLPSWGPCS